METKLLMCIIANTSVLGAAMSMGYSAVTLSALKSSDNKEELTLSESQGDWFASVAAIGTPLGCILTSFIMRRGRRPSILLTSICNIAGWLVICFSKNFLQIMVGRALTGISSGLASTPATVYAAEVSSPKNRSVVVTWTSIAIAMGVLIVYILGYIFEGKWRLISALCAAFPLLSIALTLAFMPESPIWLRDHGQLEEAEKILKKFRGIPKDAPATDEVIKELDVRPPRKQQNIIRHIFKPQAMKPFGIMVGYFFFQQFSGIFVVVYYAVDITQKAGVTIDAYLAAILIGLTRLVGTFAISYISRKYGKRVPSIVSGTGMTLSMAILAGYLYLISSGRKIEDHGIIPVICLLTYILTSTLGFLVLPFAMVGEIYPMKVKDILSGMTTCIAYIFSFAILKVYPNMKESMGEHGIFSFYAAASFIGTIFVLVFVPETKGKSLQEIEELFTKKRVDVQETEKIVEAAEPPTVCPVA